ncbi:tetratricopeptide repeat protein [Thetidibacter halocola]|uniref:Tetratricopeptide repeat protein n=1 Tax=Thetidibacter halocola TaxID=2827239 RepID=A0A8J7WCI5_9RHOB|nr:hypothetical protein [Thetidibacter halocola]MBS0123914.1 hypothetical protein [Thetidibacter halocola]
MTLFKTALVAAFLPVMALAAGSDSTSAPQPPQCTDGKVWDTQSQSCVTPKDARLDDDERMRAIRAYAYDGQLDVASAILDAMADPQADMVLTYRGFVARKAGRMDDAARWYDAALVQNPDNHLARSYRAQGWVETGRVDEARAELTQIRVRGGRGTWAEVSLRLTLDRGRGYSY